MPQMTLFAPDITCEHCTATINRAVDAVAGARYVSGDPDARSFVIEVERGEVLDRVADALAAEGYPLGPATPAGVGGSAHGVTLEMAAPSRAAFKPAYSPEAADSGAAVVYSCPCGSTTEVFRYDRAEPEQKPHSCCGHHVLIQPNAEQALREQLGDAYNYDVQTVEMPWGQPMEAVMAMPKR